MLKDEIFFGSTIHSMRYSVVFLDAGSLGDTDLTVLQQPNCELIFHPSTDEQQLFSRAQHADVLIVNKCRLNADLLTRLPKLKSILVAATGTDNIDCQAAAQLGIQVTNVQDYAATAVPQHVFALLLALTNQLFAYQAAVNAGRWSQSQHFCLLDYPIIELAQKTMVVVGYGALGQATAKLATAFGMRVLVAERPAAKVIRTGRVAFCEALAQADVLSLHCPLLPETYHLMNQQTLGYLKPGALLINTARGALIEPQALLTALQTGQLGAAALDVLSQEPPPADDPLIQAGLSNLLITPHIGWASREARNRMVRKIAANLADFVTSRQYP